MIPRVLVPAVCSPQKSVEGRSNRTEPTFKGKHRSLFGISAILFVTSKYNHNNSCQTCHSDIQSQLLLFWPPKVHLSTTTDLIQSDDLMITTKSATPHTDLILSDDPNQPGLPFNHDRLHRAYLWLEDQQVPT